MKRISFLSLAGVVVFLLIIFMNVNIEEPFSTGAVLDEAWDKFVSMLVLLTLLYT